MPMLFKGVVLGAATAAAVAFVSLAVAGSGVGSVFNLGQTNNVNATSSLQGSTNGNQLVVANQSTGAAASALGVASKGATASLRAFNLGAGPAAGFFTGAAASPFVVNSGVKVGHLNADRLDGVDSSAFVRAGVSPPWQPLPVSTSADFVIEGEPGSPLGFYKDSLGIVHLRGLLECIVTAADVACPGYGPTSVVATLPASDRPETHLVFSAWSTDRAGRLDIDSNGEVTVLYGNYIVSPTTPGPHWISLDGITFRAG